MKKAITTLALTTLLTCSAFAFGPPPMLKYESRGPVSLHQRIETCFIYADKVAKDAGTGGAQVRETKVAYTADVKNAEAVEKLIAKAKKGQVISAKCLPPPGSGTTSYSMIQLRANDSTKELPLLIMHGTQCGTKNTSAAAKKLVEFLDYNCTQQN